jgi:hypothetical protein
MEFIDKFVIMVCMTMIVILLGVMINSFIGIFRTDLEYERDMSKLKQKK